MKDISFAEAINLAIKDSMSKDESIICYGLGATDPKGIFGTTVGLEKEFGEKRVFDTPTSENAMTGVGIGAAMAGNKTIMTHQRLDFFLLALDQLVNGAAKMHYMFGGKVKIPITIRLIIGRGWGQGPTHSQNLQSWFAHIPGLKVVMPSSVNDAYSLLYNSIFDPNPVIFLEHRWLHNSFSKDFNKSKNILIGTASKIYSGIDFTVVSMSYMTLEARKARNYLKQKGISIDLIDLRTIKPIDYDLIYQSLEKTNRILVLDTGNATCSISSEIISRICLEKFEFLSTQPCRLAMPDVPEPTGYSLTKGFYTRAADIVDVIAKKLNRHDIKPFEDIPEPEPHDIPGEWFKGPF